MLTLFLLMPVVALFMAANVIAGCYLAICLGYGPPNWQTALNLVVRVTTLQDSLNAGRDWLDKKAPWADKILNRLHVPKPIVIVDTSVIEETEVDKPAESIEKVVAVPSKELPEESQNKSPEPEKATIQDANQDANEQKQEIVPEPQTA